jgi:oxygen-independent coproporphyrinogen-3 oxidase
MGEQGESGIKSLYVHIPFCRSKCAYCDFLSFPLEDEDELSRYLEALIREMALYSGAEPHTLYIGGGTPSLLDAKQFSYLHMGLRTHFRLGSVEEFSIEANPDSVDEDRIAAWSSAGVNRVSLGVQSFNSTVLKAVYRSAAEADILHAVKLLREADIHNFGIDLILGLQSSYSLGDAESAFDLFQNDVLKAVTLHPAHISIYILSIAENTALGCMLSEHDYIMLDDDVLEKMYLWAVEFLERHGYKQYELSNFALPGKESKHNMHYWRGEEYIGLGLGAVSTLGRIRTRNCKDLDVYCTRIDVGKRSVEHEELLNRDIQSTEEIMLSLRMTDGLDIDQLMNGVSEGSADGLHAYLSSLFEHGFAKRSGSRLVLTPVGMLRSNAVISDIVRITEAGKNRHS